MTPRYILRENLDLRKWDSCIRQSVNGLVYAESVYLDQMADHWDALVLGDYEAVMPLTWKRKFGIRYLYQPAFIQQGGIFSPGKTTPKLVAQFLEAAMAEFRFAEFTLNHQNPVTQLPPGVKAVQRHNYLMRMGVSYDTLRRHYDPYIRQRIKRAAQQELSYRTSTDLAGILRLYRSLYDEKIGGFAARDYTRFLKLCLIWEKENRVMLRDVWNQEGTRRLAAVILIRDGRRIYNMVSCLTPEGRKKLANYFMYDAVARECADTGRILDFEGSDVPGIAYFYRKWATLDQPYPFVRWNRLPRPLNWLKS